MSRPFLMRLAGLAVLAALLSACGSGPKTRPGRDGPEANPPARLSEVPDAEPKIEAIRSGGPNKPYEVLGQNYTPMTQDRSFSERGLASWYGRKFHGRRTASGEVYDMYAMTAAHPTLPLPSYARIRNPANGREIIVRVNDRGPFHKGRIVDLSYTAALKLDLLRGVAPVELERITFAEIRSGAWRRDAAPTVVARAPAAEAVPANAAPAVAVAAAPLDVAPPPMAPPEPEVDGAPLRPLASAPRGFWIQLGAFRQRDGAESFQRRVADELDWLSPQLAVFVDTPLFRLQAGPYASRDEARAGAERVREALQLVPVIVERK
ncbi:MAG TPA: septal ring lytic transglycosylase RlpA family protein, partial [Piscinibacter sp.]|jgi:rare lipoprotein A|uniref:septal ring lytic transglycosylase RlpA family protein n=1 Tax=Piscinibacter sp. TaxID=1903157 RepID=UPI001B53F5D0|nr:septal ring lytic transglycosylase RlpA family protein [Piscinibacter sp.]MBK7533671.1 septal ring lytic transglycosylase RlpA family protein [Piscinibacter sp.]MBL0092666.1 septal ring lytic transglycosylase RlpA family protein [Piscinibacter sp.]MBP6541086.1 septal ring lytic transglycosylase RlpA family protein [Piscinibacter sp.]HOY35040.1 septal ring lytic transglycosylase RlpA family protein [Piscinibacter sp.]HPG77027.1 septal ring lytic transglycosylase RlpA family protein [Piscinib